jgi:tetratricopeptide (TPR) repeat protein
LANLELLYNELNNNNDQYKANQVMIQIKASQAWIEFAKGNNDNAWSLMIASADIENNTEKHPVTPGEVLPARELLGDLLMAMDKPSEALVAYEKNIELSPNRFNGVYGAACAAKRLGDQEKAATYFEQLLNLAEGVNSDRVELEEAREYLLAI